MSHWRVAQHKSLGSDWRENLVAKLEHPNLTHSLTISLPFTYPYPFTLPGRGQQGEGEKGRREEVFNPFVGPLIL
eukprot:12935956-Prorocentrum_lima.AAC.1